MYFTLILNKNIIKLNGFIVNIITNYLPFIVNIFTGKALGDSGGII